jgi:hypothetical protein
VHAEFDIYAICHKISPTPPKKNLDLIGIISKRRGGKKSCPPRRGIEPKVFEKNFLSDNTIVQETNGVIVFNM